MVDDDSGTRKSPSSPDASPNWLSSDVDETRQVSNLEFDLTDGHEPTVKVPPVTGPPPARVAPLSPEDLAQLNTALGPPAQPSVSQPVQPAPSSPPMPSVQAFPGPADAIPAEPGAGVDDLDETTAMLHPPEPLVVHPTIDPIDRSDFLPSVDPVGPPASDADAALGRFDVSAEHASSGFHEPDLIDRRDPPKPPRIRTTDPGVPAVEVSGPTFIGATEEPTLLGADSPAPPASGPMAPAEPGAEITGSRLGPLRSLRRPSGGWSLPARVGLVGGVVGIAVLAFVALRSGGEPASQDLAAAPSVDELARATVQIVGLDRTGSPLCSGSGTFVSTEGMILTNAHVVTRDSLCDFESLGVAVTDDAGQPPQLLYAADLLAIDDEIDLAVLGVSDVLDGAGALPATFPAMDLGDSDALTIGDSLRILGYPEIGGDTITFTDGSVSGFTAQAGIGDRALIKTDATIAGGNSGGAAINETGQLIGVPTKARASENGPAVDCRPLADTNGDGEVDDNDNCVPIGGFLNGLRPVNLALPLIAAADEATPKALETAEPAVEVDLGDVSVVKPRFSIGQQNNAPTETILTATGGITELCLFVDWSGIPDGAQWDGIWYYNESIVRDFSLLGQSWEFGDRGENFWMCAIDDETGLEAGLYELGFFLDGELVFAEGIVLTEDEVPVVTTTWLNITDVDVCGLAINPQGSGPVGLDQLDPDTVIPPGESIELDLAPGLKVVEAYNCDGEAVADSGQAGLDIVADPKEYVIGDPGAEVDFNADTDLDDDG